MVLNQMKNSLRSRRHRYDIDGKWLRRFFRDHRIKVSSKLTVDEQKDEFLKWIDSQCKTNNELKAIEMRTESLEKAFNNNIINLFNQSMVESI